MYDLAGVQPFALREQVSERSVSVTKTRLCTSRFIHARDGEIDGGHSFVEQLGLCREREREGDVSLPIPHIVG